MIGGSWEVVIDGLGRLEAPCLDLAGQLCFSDIAGDGAIYRLGHNGLLEAVLLGRSHVGGLVAHADGGLVASGHTVAVIDDNEQRIVMTPEGGWGFNDLTTDAAGNVFVGMHGERPQASLPEIEASLWRIESNQTITHCYGGIQLTNGVGISPDGTLLYHNDTLRRVVWVSDLPASGLPTNRRVFHELRDGMPDGLAIDEAGAVWIAAIGVGKVVRVTPDGAEDLVLETPMPYVSAVCFGGSDGRDLYVTTFGGAPYDLDHSGSVIHTRVDVPGAGITPARV
jgi:sugar lactone lactonase YvrE